MKKKSDIERLEKLIGQLKSFYTELSALAKKSPNDAVNQFKLNLINKVVVRANDVLGADYMPFPDFSEFESDVVPSNSDVVLILGQYMEEAERFRSDNVMYSDYKWVYKLDGRPSDVISGPPSEIGRK